MSESRSWPLVPRSRLSCPCVLFLIRTSFLPSSGVFLRFSHLSVYYVSVNPFINPVVGPVSYQLNGLWWIMVACRGLLGHLHLPPCTLKWTIVNWFTLSGPLPLRSWGRSRRGSSCAVLHIRPLQGGTHAGRRELRRRPGVCGTLHGTGVCSEDHQQGQMQRQGKLRTGNGSRCARVFK